MQLLKRWHESDFSLAGQPLRLKLKALSYEEAPEFIRTMEAYRRKVAQDANADLFASLTSEFIRSSFERYVRLTEELQDEEEQTPIRSGGDLFRIATPGLVADVLGTLTNMAVLTNTTGKGSSSPSTSEPAGAPSASDSPATSTEPADGPSA